MSPHNIMQSLIYLPHIVADIFAFFDISIPSFNNITKHVLGRIEDDEAATRALIEAAIIYGVVFRIKIACDIDYVKRCNEYMLYNLVRAGARIYLPPMRNRHLFGTNARGVIDSLRNFGCTKMVHGRKVTILINCDVPFNKLDYADVDDFDAAPEEVTEIKLGYMFTGDYGKMPKGIKHIIMPASLFKTLKDDIPDTIERITLRGDATWSDHVISNINGTTHKYGKDLNIQYLTDICEYSFLSSINTDAMHNIYVRFLEAHVRVSRTPKLCDGSILPRMYKAGNVYTIDFSNVASMYITDLYISSNESKISIILPRDCSRLVNLTIRLLGNYPQSCKLKLLDNRPYECLRTLDVPSTLFVRIPPILISTVRSLRIANYFIKMDVPIIIDMPWVSELYLKNVSAEKLTTRLPLLRHARITYDRGQSNSAVALYLAKMGNLSIAGDYKSSQRRFSMKLSNEVFEYDAPFIIAKDGTVVFKREEDYYATVRQYIN